MVLIKALPSPLHAEFRPGNTFPVDLTWPAGLLAGRSFVATLDAAILALTVVGDVLKITASEAQTAAAAPKSTFLLTETTGGATQDLLKGTWTASDLPSTPTSLALTVQVGSTPVQVTVAAAIASPEVVHDWTIDGWTPWRTQLVNNGDIGGVVTDNALSVAAGRGRITNADNDGNLRVAYEREGTDWADSEVLSLWHGGSIFDSGVATPQMGQFHRGYVDDTGRWRAVVVTNNIFLSDVNVVNQNVWNHDPTGVGQGQLDLGSNGGNKTYSVGALQRSLRVFAVKRVDAFDVAEYSVQPVHLYGLAAGQVVDISGMTLAPFNRTGVTVASASPAAGTFTVVDTTAVEVAYTAAAGDVIPTTASARRWWPYWVRSQLVATKLRVKVWRYQDPEPDWSSTDHVVTADFGGANNPEPAARMPVGVGRCGVIGAHIRNSAFVEYGTFEARRL